MEWVLGILSILEFPDERLRKKATVVKVVDDKVRKLLDDMLETMYESRGVGLAATQVDVHQRIVVIDVSDEKEDPLFLINPEIIEKDGVKEAEEGCLSVRYLYGKVRRSAKATIEAYNENGKKCIFGASGLLAQVFQHEIDHLNGVLFIDKAFDVEEIIPPHIVGVAKNKNV